jgi:porin
LATASFSENRVSVLGGLIDLNSEFYVTDSSSIFMNSVFGIGQEIAQAGVQGPSAYPQTSLGLRVRGQFGDAFYVQGVVLDGVPGEPGHNNGTHISVRKTDGVLTVVEAGLRKEDTSKPNSVQKYSLGLWRFSNGAVDAETAPNQGLYVLVNQPIATGLAGFLRYGLSAEADGFVRDNLSGGLSLTGALASREKDQLGLGFTTSSISPLKERETVLELTYKVNFSDTVFVQPDLQYVINPSADSTTPDAVVGMLRARLGF